jgi:hypothetical protein
MTGPDQGIVAAIANAPATPGTGTDNTVRVGVVATVSPLTISLQGGTVVRPGRIFGLSLAVGNNVALVRQDNTWVVLGRVVDETVTSPGPFVTGDSVWHNVGDPGEPAFQNSWVNFAFDWQGARFRKLPTNVVEVQGLVRSGTINVPIFTLPVGYRPGNSLIWATLANAASARIDVYPTGVVQWVSGGANNFVSLTPIMFYAEL